MQEQQYRARWTARSRAKKLSPPDKSNSPVDPARTFFARDMRFSTAASLLTRYERSRWHWTRTRHEAQARPGPRADVQTCDWQRDSEQSKGESQAELAQL